MSINIYSIQHIWCIYARLMISKVQNNTNTESISLIGESISKVNINLISWTSVAWLREIDGRDYARAIAAKKSCVRA